MSCYAGLRLFWQMQASVSPVVCLMLALLHQQVIIITMRIHMSITTIIPPTRTPMLDTSVTSTASTRIPMRRIQRSDPMRQQLDLSEAVPLLRPKTDFLSAGPLRRRLCRRQTRKVHRFQVETLKLGYERCRSLLLCHYLYSESGKRRGQQQEPTTTAAREARQHLLSVDGCRVSLHLLLPWTEERMTMATKVRLGMRAEMSQRHLLSEAMLWMTVMTESIHAVPRRRRSEPKGQLTRSLLIDILP